MHLPFHRFRYSFSTLTTICQLLVRVADRSSLRLAPEAIACCHLCNGLGLPVINTHPPALSSSQFSPCSVRALLFSQTARYGQKVGPHILGLSLAGPLTLRFLCLLDVLDFVVFQGFLVCVHYMLETVR